MPNIRVPWWNPDKIIKDIIWDDLITASRYSRGKLLDIGCGNKPYEFIFKNKVSAYIGIDNKSKTADIKADFIKAKIKPNSFDTILCTQVIEHIPNPEEFLTKVYLILRKNGHVILTAPLIGSLHEEPTDFYRFTKYSLSNLFRKSGFKLIYIKEEGNWISSISSLVCFYLEGTFNRYYLRFPKKIMIAVLQIFFYFLSKMPGRFTKPKNCPMNYIVIAKK